VELKPLCWHVQIQIQIQHKKVGVQAKQLSRREDAAEAEASLGHVWLCLYYAAATCFYRIRWTVGFQSGPYVLTVLSSAAPDRQALLRTHSRGGVTPTVAVADADAAGSTT
jgi:hypothetical protein